MSEDNKPVADMAFEDALKELETIVKTLEAGDESLDRSILLYQRADALKKHCEGKLSSARERIEKITLDAAGKPTGTQDFDVG